MLVALAVLLVVAPVIEIYVMVQVANAVGVLEMLLLLVLLCAGGAWVLRVETFESMRRVRATVSAGRMPTAELLDALLVFIAGVLLVVPGFVSAALGLLLVLPPVRSLARNLVRRSVERGVGRRVRISGFTAAPGGRRGTWSPGAGGPGGRQWWRGGSGSTDEATDRRRQDQPGVGDDIIDLEGEEVWLVDVRGEIEPPRPDTETDVTGDAGLR